MWENRLHKGVKLVRKIIVDHLEKNGNGYSKSSTHTKKNHNNNPNRSADKHKSMKQGTISDKKPKTLFDYSN